MLLCAQYVLPITSEPIHNGAVLVRDGAIRDVGDAAMLKLRYPDEEVSDFGQAAILPGVAQLDWAIHFARQCFALPAHFQRAAHQRIINIPCLNHVVIVEVGR